VLGVLITTTGWITVTLLTRPTDPARLQSFYDLTHPAPRGWRKAVDVAGRGGDTHLASAALSWFLGCVAVYGAVFGVGYLLYGRPSVAVPCLAVTALAAWGLVRLLSR
jgi:solute:Na+ symporter, SSS family